MLLWQHLAEWTLLWEHSFLSNLGTDLRFSMQQLTRTGLVYFSSLVLLLFSLLNHLISVDVFNMWNTLGAAGDHVALRHLQVCVSLSASHNLHVLHFSHEQRLHCGRIAGVDNGWGVLGQVRYEILLHSAPLPVMCNPNPIIIFMRKINRYTPFF